ncbi:hypothetical protein [Mesorhizobium sp. 1M-11]|uniref:HD domain-containing protein n=1 Tax=Mesorhizobium sp. 1M-11 TaxID=1529006 RepID=UPI0006C743EC|nr:hypothetical protein [Mesorhizobium sp. 1M-11]
MRVSLITPALRTELSALYRAEDRHYHGINHIKSLLGLLDEYRPSFSDPEAIEAAIWFHDAIYDSRAKDNEARSADLAREKLAGIADAERLNRIALTIEATATHTVPDIEPETARQDAALLLDMDLSILGAAPETFDAYEAAVRREYAWVEEPLWIAGRGAVLKTFLEREHIFHTDIFRSRFEEQARKNLRRSVDVLEARSGS